MITINYLSSQENEAHFFPEALKKATQSVADALGDYGKINVYSDTVVKNNGVPNGLALFMPYEDTMLLPLLLRDPGCGFLTFKLTTTEGADHQWAQKVGCELNTLINSKTLSNELLKQYIPETSLTDILLNGLTAIPHLIEDPSKFLHTHFDVDAASISLTENEENELTEDLMTLTNTVEIRTVASTSDDTFQIGDLVGFVHSGCNLFPAILAEKFIDNIAEYADVHGLFTIDQINQGRFGVPLSSELGYEYLQWLKAAMNYALVSRYLIYLATKACLNKTFGCEVILLNDVTHAGIFEQGEEAYYTVSTRGVQPLFSDIGKKNFRLIAGQKESVALLVKPVNQDEHEDNWLQHGTSYEIPSQENIENFFEPEIAQTYIHAVNQSYCNTDIDINLALPYSFNTLATQEDQMNRGLIQPLAILTPFINVHGQLLIDEEERIRSRCRLT